MTGSLKVGYQVKDLLVAMPCPQTTPTLPGMEDVAFYDIENYRDYINRVGIILVALIGKVSRFI